MDRNEFERIKAKAAALSHSSFEYLEYEHVADYGPVIETEDLVIVRGMNAGAGMEEIHWAANGPEALIVETRKLEKPALVTFIPEQWKPELERNGFCEYGVLREYRIGALECPEDPKHVCAPIENGECAAAAAVTEACRFQSREFCGETPAWMADWIAGEDPDAKAVRACDCAVLACREGGRVAGVACVAIYADESPRGAVLWVRELAVAPEFQGKGYGKSLLLSALAYGCAHGAKRAFLMADDLNANAVALYKKAGFSPNKSEAQHDLRPGRLGAFHGAAALYAPAAPLSRSFFLKCRYKKKSVDIMARLRM